ncbi:MAG TPA: FAD-dependent oxidoreductase [Saprospiraceae bacterium]|nr:FAD-dependent oxidoreductase [Saprospiraceae bacterium]HMQ82542.1 FAD-dependent oxidoreductase [Saprospiraceae bacterium]
MEATNIHDPEYFHKVVDCQYACPAHTPVPEYIRLIAAERYTDAYMINWESNVFPGILGRTCDRPCEPACRRGRVEEEPVAICRLKRVAADNKDEVMHLMPTIPQEKNGKKIALIGGGPASLTVARDLAPLGYEIHLYDEWYKGGGMMRTQIPAFRLPESVLDEEVGYILNMGIHTHFNHYVSSMKEVLDMDYDAIFVGTGAPKGRDLHLPGREEGAANIHIGIEFLANVAFEHTNKIGRKVIVLGGGNTAMDCCRTSRRLGGDEVKVVVRSPFEDMKASPWEIQDAIREDIPIKNNMPPKEFVVENGHLKGIIFEKVRAEYDANGRRSLVSTGEPDEFIEADDVIIAIGQDNAFPWVERDLGIEFGKWDIPVLNKKTFQSTLPKVFFGGDAAFGPENIITAVAHGHQAAISIDLFCQGKDLVQDRPAPMTNLVNQKMGIHEWSYDSFVTVDERFLVPHADKVVSLQNRKVEVELGFDASTAFKEAQRCLNCDVQTVFETNKCIECDACVDICPTACITFTVNGEEADLRTRLSAPANNTSQDLYVSEILPTGRVMIKDEDVCLHCGLCAERCPTAAWDMHKYLYQVTKACKVW